MFTLIYFEILPVFFLNITQFFGVLQGKSKKSIKYDSFPQDIFRLGKSTIYA